ncbi:acyltransferase family protein [Thermophagus xiamenensis]|uniref:Predicted acyltransferase n=1 Tax=Thermophagus xiamenensis TaxID=385682 RepID=A0A1I1Z934_9BACT|nr:heparan-alpha-glucosaminide N-acetyltransferase domain-containing protein [Thermophagus xiamenensis]SFE26850.1 Predicted acyltransferase [Thermophagus xiamenensis]
MKKTERYLALDVLRGMTIALMITVNNPGSWKYIYAPLRHSSWHGCTPTDLVFPFFLFVVGVSMFFSFSKYGNTLNKESFKRLGRRTLLIFAIGLFLNSFPQWDRDYSTLRIMGVLQRIALAYGFGSLIVLSVPRKYIPLLGFSILLLYWGILGWFGGEDPYSLNGNVTIPFDAAILGEQHLYRGFGIPFDPEGLLSTIPAVVTVLLGYLTGVFIKTTEKVKIPGQLALYGLIVAIAGRLWGLVFPINKPLWTGSYVLYTAGLAAMAFALLIFIIDIKGYKKWTSFFVVFGMNPLFIYALSGLWARTLGMIIKIELADGTVMRGSTWLYENIFVPLAGNMNGSLLYALTHVFFFWVIGYFLYKKRVFIKV